MSFSHVEMDIFNLEIYGEVPNPLKLALSGSPLFSCGGVGILQAAAGRTIERAFM
jgi:hypothetical protein